MIKKTALFDRHISLGGDMVEYAGYNMPVRYENLGIIAEVAAVRTAAGLFDVSHMGELLITGENAEAELNKLLTNDICGMYDTQVRYSPLPNQKGGAIDDLLVYRYNQNMFLLVVNAANKDKDAKWIQSRLPANVGFEDISDRVAQLALQGPKSKEIMLKLVSEDVLPAKYYSFADNILVGGASCMISRTGYTGEAGYEIYCDPAAVCNVFDAILQAGQNCGIAPCGLGARDLLRLEAGMPLYGHEMDEDILLSDGGVGFAIKMGKQDFVGKAALEQTPTKFCRIGVTVKNGIARQHDKVFFEDKQIGEVTSGTHSPTLKCAIAMLRIQKEYQDKQLSVEVRGRRLQTEKTELPFFKK